MGALWEFLMTEREYSLLEIIRDPGVWIYEAQELAREGHYYLYRYDSGEGVFYRATVPAGAAAVQFYPLKSTEKVPLGGWYSLERKSHPAFQLKLIEGRKRALQ
jgi:hypothetical protein